jgi:hypothetical protein
MKKIQAISVAGLLFAGAAAMAADLQRVEVEGRTTAKPARTDVVKACPAVLAQLDEAMTAAYAREEQGGLVDVRFRVKDGVVREVKASGGPQAYRPAVQRAVSSLDCQGNGTSGVQDYAFQVEVLAPGEPARGGRRVALKPAPAEEAVRSL